MQVLVDDGARSPERLVSIDWRAKFEKETKVSPCEAIKTRMMHAEI